MWMFPKVAVLHLSSMLFLFFSLKQTSQLLGIPHDYGKPPYLIISPFLFLFILIALMITQLFQW